jgi:hypothetical protein
MKVSQFGFRRDYILIVIQKCLIFCIYIYYKETFGKKISKRFLFPFFPLPRSLNIVNNK